MVQTQLELTTLEQFVVCKRSLKTSHFLKNNQHTTPRLIDGGLSTPTSCSEQYSHGLTVTGRISMVTRRYFIVCRSPCMAQLLAKPEKQQALALVYITFIVFLS